MSTVRKMKPLKKNTLKDRAATGPNQHWHADGTIIELNNGDKAYVSIVKDGFTLEVIDVTSMEIFSTDTVLNQLSRLIEQRGRPLRAFLDNDTEFSSKSVSQWSMKTGVAIWYLRLPLLESIFRDLTGYLANVGELTTLVDLNEALILWMNSSNANMREFISGLSKQLSTKRGRR